ncbi:MAG: glycosyltransferase family 2 protein [Bacteroidales bacterium]|jgi:glycosyltransferase involved in cell wall biosynthesis
MVQKVLSIIIPAYNEAMHIGSLIKLVADTKMQLPVKKEIIIVDDGSTDGTFDIASDYAKQYNDQKIILLQNKINKGKGSAVRKGLEHASGDIVLIQDADLEYDPSEYDELIQPIIDDHADVVYGSRFIGSKPQRKLYFWHNAGNKFITFLSNLLTGLNLTDIETCFKAFNTTILKSISLHENRFGFEPEVTAKISRIKAVRIYEIGIAYHGRTYQDGKKVKWHDGLWAIWCIIKYNVWKRR